MLMENEKSKKELENSIDKLETKIAASEKTFEKIEKDYTTYENQLKSVQKALLEKKMSKLKQASDFRENLEKINEYTFEINENQKILKNFKENLDRKFKDSFFSTICRIKEILNDRNITGFHGLFIDMVQFDPKLRLGVESIAKNKLYSLIVSDYETAKEISEINRQIKGSVLNIYPLNWTKELKNKPRNYPKSQDVIILKDKVNVSKDFIDKSAEIDQLIEHIFGKALMVKNYDLALKFSKDFQLNCVTVKGEVVYSEGYLTKLGFCDSNSDKISIYLSYKAKKMETEEKTFLLEEERKKTNEFHSKDIAILREMQELQLKENHLKKSLEEIKGEMNETKKDLKSLNENIANSEILINNLENENDKIHQKITVFSNEKNVKISESNNSEYQAKNDELLKLQTDINEIKEQLIIIDEKTKEMQINRDELNQEMSQTPKENTENNSLTLEKKSIEGMIKELEKNFKNLEIKEEDNNERTEELEKKQKEIDQEIKKLEENLIANEKSISQKKQVKNNFIVQKDDYFQKKVY